MKSPGTRRNDRMKWNTTYNQHIVIHIRMFSCSVILSILHKTPLGIYYIRSVLGCGFELFIFWPRILQGPPLNSIFAFCSLLFLVIFSSSSSFHSFSFYFNVAHIPHSTITSQSQQHYLHAYVILQFCLSVFFALHLAQMNDHFVMVDPGAVRWGGRAPEKLFCIPSTSRDSFWWPDRCCPEWNSQRLTDDVMEKLFRRFRQMNEWPF